MSRGSSIEIIADDGARGVDCVREGTQAGAREIDIDQGTFGSSQEAVRWAGDQIRLIPTNDFTLGADTINHRIGRAWGGKSDESTVGIAQEALNATSSSNDGSFGIDAAGYGKRGVWGIEGNESTARGPQKTVEAVLVTKASHHHPCRIDDDGELIRGTQ